MKKIAIATSLLLPILCFAQGSDYLNNTSDHSTTYGWAIALYVLACIIVAFVGDAKGWDGLAVFAVGIFCTPLIAAILYSPYKVKKQEVVDKAIEETPAENIPINNPIISRKE